MAMIYKLTDEQASFLRKAKDYWVTYDGANHLRRSIGVVNVVLGDKTYQEPQREYLKNVREWYVCNYEPNINIGDIVRFKKEKLGMDTSGFPFKYIPYVVDEITRGFNPDINTITKLSGHKCSIEFSRFTKLKNQQR